MLSENAVQLIKSIIKNNTNEENIVTEIVLSNNFSECDAMGTTMCIKSIFLNESYNAFVCLRNFTDKETNSICEEVEIEETYTFRKGDVFIYDEDDVQYVYYCTVNVDDVKEKTDETNENKELLQAVNIFERCQGVLDNCDNSKEIWEKVKKMIDIYFE